MHIARRVYVSVPADEVLNENQRSLKWALIAKASELGFLPEIFHSSRPHPEGSLTAGRGWTFTDCVSVMRRCVGAMIIGLPRHVFSTTNGDIRMPTEYAHFEGAVAIGLDLPLLLLAEEGLAERGIFHWGGGHLITSFPADATAEWTTSARFLNAVAAFEQRSTRRRDVFLGYCSTSAGVAHGVKTYIERVIGASVLDWRTDFIEGRTILEEIEEAAKRTSVGIFLFTRDDVITSPSEQAVPRDNVVFEAGFFAHAKGRSRVLIVREEGTKMPADLGGSIYAWLSDRTNLEPLEPRLRRFLDAAL